MRREIVVLSWTSDVMSSKPVEIFEPESAPRGVVLFLHGYDGLTLRENQIYTAQLEKHGLACLCPLGPQCWWTDRIFPQFDPVLSPVEFLAKTVPDYCQSRWQIDSSRLAVCGVEMGGQGALQLAYRHARKFPVVAAVSPIVNFESWHGHGTTLDEIFPDREAARQTTAILHIHPLDWPRHQLLLCDPADNYCIDGVQRLASKLSSSGIPYDSDFETTHGGFGWGYANAMAPTALRYIATHLSK
jgi:S-formylglutathione hydrolase